MISFEDAVKIAKQYKKNANTCIEYERGYSFGSTEDNDFVGGYGHEAIGIMKDDGRVLYMHSFIDADPGKQIGDVMPI